jgi:glycerol-3-phosphate dehydrogenase
VAFILGESARYLRRPPCRADVRSIWVGLRPLVKPQSDSVEATKAISREHTVLVSRSGLVTVTGGKWTTYRAMAEDVLSTCVAHGLVVTGVASRTGHLHLVGSGGSGHDAPVSISAPPGLHSYGVEAPQVAALPGATSVLCDGLSEAMVRFAARYEYAVTVEDMLARRSRLLFLDARAALGLADRVAAILQQETRLDPQTQAFKVLAEQYFLVP